MKTFSSCINFGEDLLEQIDTARGSIPRSQFVQQCVKAALYGCDVEISKVRLSRKKDGA